jgi:hypothetical protein
MRRRGACTVAEESVSATLSVAVPAARVFAVLADPTTHCAIDGTGWVQEAVDRVPLAEMGQIFRMDVYHPPTPTAATRWPTRCRCWTRHAPLAGCRVRPQERRSPGVRRLDVTL